MSFITQDKNNVKYLLIVFVVALVFGVGIIYWEGKIIKETGDYSVINNQTNKPNTESQVSDDTADWKTYRNDKYGFEVKYPTAFPIEKIDEGINMSFPSSYKGLSYVYNNDIQSAWIGVGVGFMNKEGFTEDFCQSFNLGVEKITINGINFWKRTEGKHFESDPFKFNNYQLYNTLYDGNCYEVVLAVNAKAPVDYASMKNRAIPGDQEKLDSILGQIVSTFEFTK